MQQLSSNRQQQELKLIEHLKDKIDEKSWLVYVTLSFCNAIKPLEQDKLILSIENLSEHCGFCTSTTRKYLDKLQDKYKLIKIIKSIRGSPNRYIIAKDFGLLDNLI